MNELSMTYAMGERPTGVAVRAVGRALPNEGHDRAMADRSLSPRDAELLERAIAPAWLLKKAYPRFEAFHQAVSSVGSSYDASCRRMVALAKDPDEALRFTTLQGAEPGHADVAWIDEFTFALGQVLATWGLVGPNAVGPLLAPFGVALSRGVAETPPANMARGVVRLSVVPGLAGGALLAGLAYGHWPESDRQSASRIRALGLQVVRSGSGRIAQSQIIDAQVWVLKFIGEASLSDLEAWQRRPYQQIQRLLQATDLALGLTRQQQRERSPRLPEFRSSHPTI